MKIKEIIKLATCFYLPPLVLLLHFICLKLGLYFTGLLDIPMHFLGGGAIAYSCILVLRKVKDKVIINHSFFEILIIVSLVGLSAVLWEFSEYIFGMGLGIDDTLLDLCMGLVGGLTINSLVKIKINRKI